MCRARERSNCKTSIPGSNPAPPTFSRKSDDRDLLSGNTSDVAPFCRIVPNAIAVQAALTQPTPYHPDMAQFSRTTKVLPVVVGALAAGVFGIFGRQLGNSLVSPGKHSTIASQASLSKLASDMNKGLPMMVDKETELMNTLGLEGVVAYNYRFVNTLSSEIDATQLLSELKAQVSRSACTNPQTRDGLLKHGVTMRYTYVDRDRTYIGSFDVTPASCGF